MIYRIITEFRMVHGKFDPEQKGVVAQWVVPEEHEYRELVGAGSCFCAILEDRSLRAPLIQNPRARLYFTERG